MLRTTNYHNQTYTVDSCVAEVNLNVMNPKKAGNTNTVPHAHLLLMKTHPEQCEHILSQLFHEQTEYYGKRWYLAPKKCDDPSKLNKIERRIYVEIVTFQGKEQLIPTKSYVQREAFLSNFNCEECLLNEDNKTRVEHLLVKYQSIFKRLRLDFDNNTEF